MNRSQMSRLFDDFSLQTRSIRSKFIENIHEWLHTIPLWRDCDVGAQYTIGNCSSIATKNRRSNYFDHTHTHTQAQRRSLLFLISYFSHRHVLMKSTPDEWNVSNTVAWRPVNTHSLSLHCIPLATIGYITSIQLFNSEFVTHFFRTFFASAA